MILLARENPQHFVVRKSKKVAPLESNVVVLGVLSSCNPFETHQCKNVFALKHCNVLSLEPSKLNNFCTFLFDCVAWRTK